MEFKTIKRGQQIFNVCAYNFCQIGVERKSEEWDSTKRVYYKENTDEIIIEEWTVHSIGKKVMRLYDSKGNMKKDAVYSNWFNPSRWANSIVVVLFSISTFAI